MTTYTHRIKKVAAAIAFMALMLLQANSVWSSTAQECKKALGLARGSLVDMLSDGKKDSVQQKLVKSSADDTRTCFNQLSVPGNEKDVDELKKIWSEFQDTRESKIVPLILSGKTEEAKSITSGVQKERLDKMNSILKRISGGDL